MEYKSYAKLPGKRVALACSLYLNHIDERNQKEIDKKIDQILSYGPWKRFFSFCSFKPLTREEALAEMKRSQVGMINDYDRIIGPGRYWYKQAESLLILASYADDVLVDAELFGEISTFYEKGIDTGSELV